MIRSIYRLVKLATHVFLGYACYEFVSGLMGDARPSGRTARTRGGYRTHWDEPRETEGRPRMSVEGATVRTEDASGVSSSHTVGRGVVSR